MAALRFQIHVDKENTGAIGANPKHRQGSSSGVIRGKVFQESSTPGLVKPRKALGDVNTPASNRPRKALGDVNGTNEPILKGKSGGLKPLSLNTQSFKKPETKKVQEKSLKKQEAKVSVPVVHALPSIRPVLECEEIEQMHNERDPDDDEDIWPAKERISTYIDKLISWRPPCLFGVGASESDDEEENRRIEEMIGQLDSLPVPIKPAVEEEPLPPAESLVVPLEYEDVPYADITLESLQLMMPDNPHDVTPQGLEDSYSVVPRLGTLAMKEDI